VGEAIDAVLPLAIGVSLSPIAIVAVVLTLATPHGLAQWRRRPGPRAAEDAAPPAWMATLDTVSPLKSVGLGVALSAVNPKNLLITVGAAAAIVQTGADAAGPAVALAVWSGTTPRSCPSCWSST
jgi:threonine/homoserine/homoserine lactone efflux protein